MTTLTPAWTIARKRDGHELTDAEIRQFLHGYVCSAIPDYQMAALAMAIFLRGMTAKETADLTRCMLHSGAILKWDSEMPIVDKHSTGGIGDKISLILAPVLACLDVRVPMISGRGLGATGGTLDKLESIPGFRTDLSLSEFQSIVRRVGCAISGATDELVPADRKLYALRDVTATVASIPLITASIMSKKLAEGLDGLVMDVKWGSGAFMQTYSAAHELAESLISVGQQMSLPVSALISDMNQPLGRCAGNALEVQEAIETLAGCGPPDVIELVVELGTALLTLVRADIDPANVRKKIHELLQSGMALDKFQAMVAEQGGDLRRPRHLAPCYPLLADTAGYIVHIDTEALGQCIVEMGGGRKQLGDRIDHSVGLKMEVRIGDAVDLDQPLLSMFIQPSARERIGSPLRAAFQIGPTRPEIRPLIAERISTSGFVSR